MDKNGMDFKEINIERMKALFPECVTDGKIDFDKLKVLLGEEVDSSNEKYSFNWIGKNASIKNAITPSTATLIPCKEKSKNWDTTENLYVEGDNLEVLKTLSKTYHGLIKMIYIDPPYNTGREFVYNDDFSDSIHGYVEQTSQTTKANPETSGRYHTNWLNMMYPRLKIAKDLLAKEGAIFISIDDNELYNLKKICDEIFGEFSFEGVLVWKTKTAAKGVPTKNMLVTNHDYILVYSKTKEFVFTGEPRDASDFGNPDNDPRGPWKADNMKSTTSTKVFSITDPATGNVYSKTWAFSEETLKSMIQENKIIWPDTPDGTPRQKRFLSEMTNENTPLRTLIGEFQSETATNKLKEMFDGSKLFDFPKHVNLLSLLVNQATKDGDVVLDFFSGSGTTAHAVMQLNTEDGGKRKFIMVQLPELCEDGSEAKKAGYNTICDIGQDRIRRAGKKIYDELKDKYDNAGLFKEGIANPDDFDFGFKVFKLDSTCIKPWDPTVKYDESNLFELMDVIKEGRSNLDVAYEIMLKYGVFNMPLEEKVVNGKTIYSVGGGYMIISLNDEITSDDVKAIAELKPKAVVFKESGFKDDSAKMNADYTFKRLGIDNVKCI